MPTKWMQRLRTVSILVNVLTMKKIGKKSQILEGRIVWLAFPIKKAP
jgi:hypothetical protein